MTKLERKIIESQLELLNQIIDLSDDKPRITNSIRIEKKIWANRCFSDDNKDAQEIYARVLNVRDELIAKNTGGKG